MIRMKARGAIAITALGSLVLLSGCTGGPGGSDLPEDGAAVDARAYEGSTVRVLRHSGYDADVMQELFAAFTEETGIKVVMDQVPFSNLRTKEVTELSSGSSTYDLMSTPDYWLAEYGGAGWAAPLDEMIGNSGLEYPDFAIDDINDRLLDANVVDGATYALPWKFNAGVLAYRTDVFAEAPATYDDWLSGLENAEAAGLDLAGLSLGATSTPEFFIDLVVANGGEFLNEDDSAAAFNTTEGKEALEFLVELSSHAADGAVNRAWDESAQLMASGVTASDILLSSVAPTAATGEGQDKVAFTPIVPLATTSSMVNTWGLLIPEASENKQAAFLLMQYLLSPESVRTMAEGGGGSVVPARDSLLQELTSEFASFEAQKIAADTGSLWPKIDTLDASRVALATPIQDAVLGRISVDEALAQGEEAVNAALNP